MFSPNSQLLTVFTILFLLTSGHSTSAAPTCMKKSGTAASTAAASALSSSSSTSSSSSSSYSVSSDKAESSTFLGAGTAVASNFDLAILATTSISSSSTSASSAIPSSSSISSSSSSVPSAASSTSGAVSTATIESSSIHPSTATTVLSPSAAVTTPYSAAISASKTTVASTTAVVSTSKSSSAPVSASTASTKIGLGWPVQEIDAAPVALFFTEDSKVSWWYDWNKNWNQGLLTSTDVAINGEFIPMLYDPTFYDNSDTLEDGWTEIMGYNEPDLHSATGVATFVEPATAATKWKTQITAIRAANPSARVHSPVMASNKTWLLDFFAEICPDDTADNAWGDCTYKPDYVSMHIYTTDADYFEVTVSDYHTSFGLPLVVSEWACYDFNSDPSPSASDVSAFMSTTMAWMDDQDWIVKYAWFGSVRSSDYLYGVAETNRLMDTNGALTDLGKQYIAGGTA